MKDIAPKSQLYGNLDIHGRQGG